MTRLICSVLLFILVLSFFTIPARAQQKDAQGEALAGTTFTPAHLRDLPASDNVYSLLETSEGEVISDRFYGGGLNTGRSALDGAFLNSWRQTQYFVGDVNVTMPNGGTPFFFPTVTPWDRVDVAAAMMPITANAQGLAVSFQPARPGATWSRFVEASGAGGGLIAKSSTTVAAPAIETLRQWSHAGLFVSGPVSPRVGLMANVEWSGARQVERNDASQADGQLASVMSHLVFKRSDRDEIRLLGWIQRTQAPWMEATLLGQAIADQTTYGHFQATYERQTSIGGSERLFGAYSQASASRDHELQTLSTVGHLPTVERLLVGPVPDLIVSGNHTDRQWEAGARWNTMPRDNDHMLSAGADVTGAAVTTAPAGLMTPLETIDGIKARRWFFPGTSESHRHATFINAFIADRIGLGEGRSFELGVSYDGVTGSADGAAQGITWNNVLPRVLLRWKQGSGSHFTWVAGYRRAVDRLTLDTLAAGDPAAPAGVVSPVNEAAAPALTGIRVGPGTGGDPAFSGIDSSLKRPVSDEIAVGIDAQLSKNVRGRITAVAREVRNLFDLADIGVPASGYAQFTTLDGRPEDYGGDVLLPVYTRLPATSGADRYLLMNRAGDEGRARGAAVVLNSEANVKRLTLLFNATASITDGPAENRGFRVNENNLGALGEVSMNPNAANDARGRLFYDRAFTLKLSGIYRFPHAITLGVIARYQDGQPLSRLTILPGVTDPRQPNQGPELIRAEANGDTRFMYTGTLDVRLKKAFVLGGGRSVDVFVDAYNLPNMANEVEENVVTGPNFRFITAVQPPASVHIGARVNF